MKTLLIFAQIILSSMLPNNQSVGNLTIKVVGIPSTKGNLMVAVYNKEEGFREKDKTFRNLIEIAQKGTMEVNINQLPAGNYAVAVYHDANGNGKLDKNVFGVPTEYYGFSNDAKGSFGPPSFDACKFNFSAGKSITINLK